MPAGHPEHRALVTVALCVRNPGGQAEAVSSRQVLQGFTLHKPQAALHHEGLDVERVGMGIKHLPGVPMSYQAFTKTELPRLGFKPGITLGVEGLDTVCRVLEMRGVQDLWAWQGTSSPGWHLCWMRPVGAFVVG